MPFDYPTRAVIEQALLVFATLFPIVNPVGGAPVFLALTHGVSSAKRSQLARRVAFYALVLVLASALVGGYVIEFFGLSVPVIQIGGGLLVCSVAWNLLRSEDTQSELSVTAQSRDQLAARAFYPLTMPLTVGPGSILVAITLGPNPVSSARAFVVTIVAQAVGLAIVCLAIYLIFGNSHKHTPKIYLRAGCRIQDTSTPIIHLCLTLCLIRCYTVLITYQLVAVF